MELNYTSDSIYKYKPTTIIVPCSCKGNIGNNDLLLYIRRNFKEVFKNYKKRCTKKRIFIGEPILIRNLDHEIIKNIIFLPIRREEGETIFLANRLIMAFNNLYKLCLKEEINEISIDVKSLEPLSKTRDIVDKVFDFTLSSLNVNIHTTEIHASDKTYQDCLYV